MAGSTILIKRRSMAHVFPAQALAALRIACNHHRMVFTRTR
jgi:hypothetical protein